MATVLDSLSASESDLSSSYRSARPVVGFDEARELAERHGSPLMVYSRSAVLRNFRAMSDALPGVEFFYAAKSNPARQILEPLAEAGCSVDVCSWGEMQAALRAGFSPDRMIHTHPCKTVDNLTRCHDAGCNWFVFDNANELRKIARYTPDVNLILRLAVSSSSSVINLSAKFGAAEHDAVGLMLQARAMGLRVAGLSFHVGSQCHSPEDFQTAFMQARRVWDGAAAHGIELEVLDFGGGIPAPYRETVLTLDSYCGALQGALETTFGDVSCRVIGEPGRGMSADTATLITRVLGKSVRNGLMWYIIDDGLYGSFSGQVYDHTEFPLIAENMADRPLFPCVVAGPTCDSSDVVCRNQELPELEIGDLLLVPTMGAYCAASASNFNGLDIAQALGVD